MSTLNKIPTPDQIKRLPKALLHDHLDGGLRPQTIIDIAKEIGHELPSYDAAELAEWFRASCDSGSLVRYLVRQRYSPTPELLHRFRSST
jgi:adenosine deaminase